MSPPNPLHPTLRPDLRAFLTQALQQHGDHAPFADGDSLFLSGRLDSFTMMNLVVHLEATHGVDFGALDFDVALVDTVDAMAALVPAQGRP